MRFMDAEDYRNLIQGAELLREDGFGPKVYQTPDGRIVKLFRIKRWLSSSVLYPYTLRFQRNSRRLQRMGIACVDVDDIFYCHAIRRHGLIYRRLDGTPLDELLVSADDGAVQLFRDYGAFIAMLHRRRIYFRSLHPGNILLLPGGGLGLIDVADMRFPWLRLTPARRRRNFRHLFRSVEFRQALRFLPGELFVNAYLEASDLGPTQRVRLGHQLLADIEALDISVQSG
jgi:serine/threonine protein kinase